MYVLCTYLIVCDKYHYRYVSCLVVILYLVDLMSSTQSHYSSFVNLEDKKIRILLLYMFNGYCELDHSYTKCYAMPDCEY